MCHTKCHQAKKMEILLAILSSMMLAQTLTFILSALDLLLDPDFIALPTDSAIIFVDMVVYSFHVFNVVQGRRSAVMGVVDTSLGVWLVCL